MEVQEEAPARGLRQMLSKTRHSKDDLRSSPYNEPAVGGDSSESVLGKLKARMNSIDDDSDSTNKKMSKLLPGFNRRKKRLEAQGAAGAPEGEENRGRSHSSEKAATSAHLGIGKSTSSLGSNEDEESSMMTSDSEDEDNHLAKAHAPPLRSHDSHIGYLTTSSPVIKATTVGSDQNTDPSKAAMPANDTPIIPPPGAVPSASTNLATHDLFSFDQPQAGSSVSIGSSASAQSSKSRGVSPGAKLKDVFKSSSKKKENAQNGGAENRTKSPSKAGSIASRRALRNAEGSANSQSVESLSKSASQSTKSLPSIIMTPDTPPPLPTATLEGPATTVTPPTPVDPSVSRKKSTTESISSISQNGNGAAPLASVHRRARSDSASHQPSKLSQSMNAPLTPTIEEVRSPGVRGNPMSNSGGFFTSMFNIAQNATNTITTSLGNNNNNNTNSSARPRTATSQTRAGNENHSRSSSANGLENVAIEEKPAAEPAKLLAIDTIGTGDLSLSHLGISNDLQSASSTSPGSTMVDLNNRSRSSTVVHREEASARAEDISAARAVDDAYNEKLDHGATPMVEDIVASNQSSQEVNRAEDRGTPNGSVIDGEPGGILRSASIRSKVDRTRRRHRNSSGTTGTTIGAAIGASHSALLGSSNASVPKLTGFAVATKKRNRDFHQLFRSVPEDDYLIEDYSCALQRDIILAGRIYISEGHVCFSSNILGWVTTLVISFDEVVSVEKESTAMVFPNAIAIQTLHARHTFRSLLSREATYDLLIGIWKINHPGLQSSENGVRLTNGTGSKTEKVESLGSDDGSDGSPVDDIDDEDDDEMDDDGRGSDPGTIEGSLLGSEVTESPAKPAIPRKPSNIGVAAGQAAGQGPTTSDSKAAEKAIGAAAASADFAGPATHAPTECSDSSTHYEKILKDEVIPAPLGKVFSMVFGAASGGFMSRWLTDEVKVLDLQMEDDKKGLSEENRSRGFTYIKPLGGSIGPKQTKCIINEQLDAFDLEKAVSVTVTTQTPDVPSGNVFSVKTRYCMMWGPGNGTRMIMCCTIEWTGKSWLKGPIEKGANDGQIGYANDLFKALRAGVTKGRPSANGVKGKKSRKKKGDAEASKSDPALSSPSKAKAADWGLLEPWHGLLGPIADPLEPLFSMNGLVILLVVLLAISYFRPSGVASTSAPGGSSSQRTAAYEEMWRTEEAALWAWLEDRVGGRDGLAVPVGGGDRSSPRNNADQSRDAQKARKAALQGMVKEGIGEREVERAIEITEEKLRVLKDAVMKNKGGGAGGGGRGGSEGAGTGAGTGAGMAQKPL